MASIYMYIFLDSQFYSISLYVYLYANPILLDYFSFVVLSFGIGKSESSDFVLFQDCWAIQSP